MDPYSNHLQLKVSEDVVRATMKHVVVVKGRGSFEL